MSEFNCEHGRRELDLKLGGACCLDCGEKVPNPPDFVKMKNHGELRMTVFDKDCKMTIGSHFNGVNIKFSSKDGVQLLSAVCHEGSYGNKSGLWEIMPAHPMKYWGDEVKGWLSFKDVLRYLDKELRLLRKENKTKGLNRSPNYLSRKENNGI